MNILTRYVDEIDQRRGYVQPRICAACDHKGTFDDFHDHYTAEHQEALATEFGGPCCTDCLATWAPCQECGEVVYSMTLDEEAGGLCKSCSYDFWFASQRGW